MGETVFSALLPPPNPPHLLDLLKSEDTMKLVCIYRYFTRLNKNNKKN